MQYARMAMVGMFVWMAGALIAGPVRSVKRTGSCELNDRQSIAWEAEYPIQIEGWTADDLQRLWKLINHICFTDHGDGAYHLESQDAASETPDAFMHRFIIKIQPSLFCLMIDPEYVPIREMSNKVSIPYASGEWVALKTEGFNYFGGAGCHGYLRPMLLTRATLKPMPLAWLFPDEEAAKRVILTALDKELNGQLLNDGSPTADMLKATPAVFPTPEGLCFTYWPYEITAGCFGCPQVTLSWEALAPLANADRLAELQLITNTTP